MAQDEAGRELGRHERYRGDYPIVVEGLSKRFGDVVAVSSVSFSVPAHSTTALLGGNGAGKTTTLKIILRIGNTEFEINR